MKKSNLQKIVNQVHKDIRAIKRGEYLDRDDILSFLDGYLKLADGIKPDLWNADVYSELLHLIISDEPYNIRRYSPVFHETNFLSFSERKEEGDKVRYLYRKHGKCFSIEMPKVSDEHKKIIKDFINSIVFDDDYKEE